MVVRSRVRLDAHEQQALVRLLGGLSCSGILKRSFYKVGVTPLMPLLTAHLDLPFILEFLFQSFAKVHLIFFKTDTTKSDNNRKHNPDATV